MGGRTCHGEFNSVEVDCCHGHMSKVAAAGGRTRHGEIDSANVNDCCTCRGEFNSLNVDDVDDCPGGRVHTPWRIYSPEHW